MMKLWVILLLLLCSCDAPQRWTDPAFDPIITDIKDKYGIEINSGVFLGRSPSDRNQALVEVAHCFKGSNIVAVDKDMWKPKSTRQKEMLLIHEAGHCMYGLGHNEELVNGKPVSIMHSMISTFDITDEEMEELVNQFIKIARIK